MLLKEIPPFFKARRNALMKAYPSSVFIFPSNDEVLRNYDVTYPFRQESNFYYLTGFEEPGSFLVLFPSHSALSHSGGYRMSLFVRKRDPDRELWDGERYGVEGAIGVFQADEAYPTEEFDQRLPELLSKGDTVFYRLGLNESKDRRVLAALETYRASLGRSGKSLAPLSDPHEGVGELRLFKNLDELTFLRKACQITALAHKIAMQEVRVGMYEYEIEALMDYIFHKNGCRRVGYGSIVAGGKNAACLHYRTHNEPLKDGELLLIDAGGEVNYYTADTTRTFPIGKSFSKAQEKAYQLVLQAQKEGIALARPGSKLTEIHQRVCEVLVDGFLSLGLLKGGREEIIKNNIHRRFYPHNTSHWLGMDVHDVGLYTKNGEPRILEPGMVFTIEPGFYVQPLDLNIPVEYKNLGIRIEDDILITSQGCEILTREAPKELFEIEALRQS